jgi:hypothetical protein
MRYAPTASSRANYGARRQVDSRKAKWLGKFKVGERVERISGLHNRMDIPAYGTVTAITQKGITVQYDSDINETHIDADEHDFRTIEQNPARLNRM